MPHPFTPVGRQIERYFPADEHPYRKLEQFILERLKPSYTLLDIGCGRTAPTLKRFEGFAEKLYGIDLVEFEHPGGQLILSNESITEMPTIASKSVDLAYSRSVMEHIAEPASAFAEIFRVLKPGGSYIFLTANKYDYASIIAALVPNKLHPMIVKFSEGREEFDTFPTEYKVNSRREIQKFATNAGFKVSHFERLAQYPNYFNFNRVLFWIASQYERMIRRFDSLAVARGWILCEVSKPRD